MKKLSFALACIIGMMFFASCDPEIIDDLKKQKPEISFVTEEGFISTDVTVYEGTELNFKVTVSPNSSSMSELVNYDFSITDLTGNTVYNSKPEFTDPFGENIFTESFTPEEVSTYTVTATVTDAAGKINAVELLVNYVAPTTEGLGTYVGTIDIQGHLTSNEIQGQSYDMDTTLYDLPIQIVLGSLEEDNRVRADITIEDRLASIYGTMENDVITFDEFHFHKIISLIFNVELDLVMNMTGTLTDDVLSLDGTSVGSGKTQVLIAMFEVNLDGTISGEAQKVVE